MSSAADDGLPSADELSALASQLAAQTNGESSSSLTQLDRQARKADAESQRRLEASLLEQAPAYIKLHSDLQASRSLLGELESFLDVFYNDLSTLSGQMSALQTKSMVLAQRLRNRRALEGKLRTIVADIVLEPAHIDLIFADEGTAGRAGLEAWKGCAERLGACLRACAELDGVLRDELKLGRGANVDVKALREAREVAEACRVAAVTKVRTLLISTFAPLRTSLSTNLPVLQSVLLKSYRPLFIFLSHHAPRVAIDVQRAYVAAARLYFETGFRRYERSLARLRDREKAKSAEGLASLTFTEAPAKSSIGVPAFGVRGGKTDPWQIEEGHLDNARIFGGPAVTLAYLADNATFRAPLEALFRSLSLTFLDNATSEYCFLARFFESVDLDIARQISTTGTSSITGSSNTGSSAVKVQHADAQDRGDDTDGPAPEDSASAKGDDDVEEAAAMGGTVVRFSEVEKRRLRGRGAIDELWKQVMDPVVNTYTNFVNSIIAQHPTLVSLYTMLKLNDRALAEVQDRGASSVLQGTFMSFKLRAWPMLQKQFDDAIEAVKRLRTSGDVGSASVVSAASNLLGGFGGFFGGSAQQAGTGTSDAMNALQLACGRYARLFSSIVFIDSMDAEEQDSSVSTSLGRLRSEIEALLDATSKQSKGGGAAPGTSNVAPICYQLIRNSLETGPASVSLPRIQAELSHWTEAARQNGAVV